MNTKNPILLVGLAIAVGCAIAGVMAVKRQQAAPEATRQQAALKQQNRKPLPETAAASLPAEETISAPQIESPKIDPGVTTQKVAAIRRSGTAQTAATQDGIQDPLAREALSLVGADPEANAYWESAINDPSLSADERQNLIEDLNEDGLSDPRHARPEDMPLIMSRIRLIEQLAPYAMDQVNADAFGEAYKDLVNLLNGEPVQ